MSGHYWRYIAGNGHWEKAVDLPAAHEVLIGESYESLKLMESCPDDQSYIVVHGPTPRIALTKQQLIDFALSIENGALPPEKREEFIENLFIHPKP